MFDSLIDAFGKVLAFFYELVPSYGIAIILVTVAIRLLLYPMTSRQARSMAKMQKVQPEIKKLQEKYKNDRQKLNEEMMAFYKEQQINPLAGCLPLVLQFPIFIALFQVLRLPGALKHIPVDSDLFRAFCPSTETVQACRDAGVKGLSFLGMDLSKGANSSHASFVDALPYFFLLVLVIASGYYQSRQMTQLQKGRATPQNQMMTRIFPVFFGLISYSLPAGVVLYFFVSNLWQIGQQAVVFGRETEAVGASKGKPKAGGAKSGGAKSGGGQPSADAPKARGLLGGLLTPPPPKSEPAAAPESGDAEPTAQGPSDGPPPSSPISKAPRGAGGGGSAQNRPNRSNARKKKKRKRRR